MNTDARRKLVTIALVITNVATLGYFLWPKIDPNNKVGAAISSAFADAGNGIEDIVETSVPTATLTPTPTPEPTLSISKENNPFVVAYPTYDVTDSFNLLFKPIPVDNLEGTVVDSYLGLMTIHYGGYSSNRPFSWIELRNQQGEILYLIYPFEKLYSRDDRLVIGRYWATKEDVQLMDNMLVYIVGMKEGWNESYNYMPQLDFAIPSAADDGHVDGIIEPGTIINITSGE